MSTNLLPFSPPAPTVTPHGPSPHPISTGWWAVLDICGEVRGQRVLDLGCGDGRCARELARRGATVHGIDISRSTLAFARAREERIPLEITYEYADVVGYRGQRNSLDLIIAVALFQELNIAEMHEVMARVYGLLRPGGRFVFSVPHPSLPIVQLGNGPYAFDLVERGYFTSRDQMITGETEHRGMLTERITLYHKTLTDYFEGLGRARFSAMPLVRELEIDPHYGPHGSRRHDVLEDLPFHLLFAVER